MARGRAKGSGVDVGVLEERVRGLEKQVAKLINEVANLDQAARDTRERRKPKLRDLIEQALGRRG